MNTPTAPILSRSYADANHAAGAAGGVGQASRLSPSSPPLANQKVTVHSHPNRPEKSVPGNVRDRRDACPTAWIRLSSISNFLKRCALFFKLFGTNNTARPPSPERLHHRAGWLGISLLMLPILGWVWLVAREPVISVFNGAVPRYVLSGKLISEPFNIVHAGFALDQPTIGKWLFWFSFMAGTSLPYAAAVGWFADRNRRSGRLAFGFAASLLGVFLLCMLSWPMSWLIQYVCSMGFTPRRTYGLAYAIAGGLLVVGFVAWAFRNPKRKDTEPA